MRIFNNLLLPVSAAVVVATTPARAQIGNQSDPGPPVISTAGAGSYLGPGLRTQNDMFVGSGDEILFRNAAIGCAVRNAERAFGDSVVTAPRTAAQLRVQTLLGLVEGAPDAPAVAAALAKGADPASPLGQASRSLADALAGLMRNRCACADNRDQYTEAPQWREAIVRSSSPENSPSSTRNSGQEPSTRWQRGTEIRLRAVR